MSTAQTNDEGAKPLARWRTYDIDGGQMTHLEGPGDSYTLCGYDIAGDTKIHRKPPELLKGRKRITCPQCHQVISFVKDFIAETPAHP